MRKLRISLIVAACLFATGCSFSLKDITVEDVGGKILDLVGLGPLRSVYNASESLLRASENLTREEEYFLGRAVAARILTQYKPVTNKALIRYVNIVGTALVGFSDTPETFGGYHFMILDTDEANALAAPGGFIFITRGLLNLIPDEDTLAFVLAHEIGHITEQHGIDSISQAKMNEALASLGSMAGSLNCAEVMQQASVVFSGAVDDIVVTILDKGYSREQEYEADQEGIKILARSGYNPYSSLDMLRQLSSLDHGHGGWLNSHPASQDRLDRVAEELQSGGYSEHVKGKLARTQRFNRILKRS